MLADALACVNFSWEASPASTELEVSMMNWMAREERLTHFGMDLVLYLYSSC